MVSAFGSKQNQKYCTSANYPITRKFNKGLTHFQPMVQFYTRWKYQKPFGFLFFLRFSVTEVEHWLKAGYSCALRTTKKFKTCNINNLILFSIAYMFVGRLALLLYSCLKWRTKLLLFDKEATMHFKHFIVLSPFE